MTVVFLLIISVIFIYFIFPDKDKYNHNHKKTTLDKPYIIIRETLSTGQTQCPPKDIRVIVDKKEHLSLQEYWNEVGWSPFTGEIVLIDKTNEIFYCTDQNLLTWKMLGRHR